ncbi:MAG: hypothetical protein AABZ30_01030 [Myxococcota bacterium]
MPTNEAASPQRGRRPQPKDARATRRFLPVVEQRTMPRLIAAALAGLVILVVAHVGVAR